MSIPTGGVARLRAGFGLPIRALQYLAARPELHRYAVLPLVIAVLAFAVALIAGGAVSGWLLQLLWSRPENWLSALWVIARVGLWAALTVSVGLAVAFTASAPFTDRLSARVEALELGEPEAGGLGRAVAETFRGVTNSLVRSAWLVLGLVVLFPLVLVPVVHPVLSFLWVARWTAVEWLDLPMARNLRPLRDVRAALRAVRPMGFGFGSALTIALGVPFANFLVVPVGAVAGTLLYCDLVRAGVVPRAAGAGQVGGARRSTEGRLA